MLVFAKCSWNRRPRNWRLAIFELQRNSWNFPRSKSLAFLPPADSTCIQFFSRCSSSDNPPEWLYCRFLRNENDFNVQRGTQKIKKLSRQMLMNIYEELCPSAAETVHKPIFIILEINKWNEIPSRASYAQGLNIWWVEESKTSLNCLMSFATALWQSGRSRFLWVLVARLVYSADAETFLLFASRMSLRIIILSIFLPTPTPELHPGFTTLQTVKYGSIHSNWARKAWRRVLTRSFVRSIFEENCFIVAAFVPISLEHPICIHLRIQHVNSN